MYSHFFKRFFDALISGLALIILFPLFILVGLIIYLQDRGPLIFKQRRVGRYGKEFVFYKFRSMPVNMGDFPSSEVHKIKITPFGKMIRRTSIDELPQLYNIFRGDMSIIGPRPPIPSQQNLIKLRRENGSLTCRPGLTGWAQVNSYDFMPDEVKANFDAEYARRISFLMDLNVFFKTFLYLTKKPPTY